MNLIAQVRATCERHSRAITDHGGRIPDQLVTDLVLLAEQYAATVTQNAEPTIPARKTTTRKGTGQ